MTDTDTPVVDEVTEVSPVTDLPGLFLYSGMVDGLRDTAKVLLRPGVDVSSGTLDQLVEQYTTFRTLLSGVLTEAAAEELLERTIELGGNATIDGIYAAAFSLSRWMDLVHTTPNFLFGQRVQEVTIRAKSVEINAQEASLPPVATPSTTKVPQLAGTPAVPSTGQYL